MFYPGSGSDHCSIPDPGDKKAPDPGSATLVATLFLLLSSNFPYMFQCLQDIDFTIWGRGNKGPPRSSPARPKQPAAKAVAAKESAAATGGIKTTASLTAASAGERNSSELDSTSTAAASKSFCVKFNFDRRRPKRSRRDTDVSVDLADLG
jgi:hypothetical protein